MGSWQRWARPRKCGEREASSEEWLLLLMMMLVMDSKMIFGSVVHSPFLYSSVTPPTWFNNFNNGSFTVIEDRAYLASSPGSPSSPGHVRSFPSHASLVWADATLNAGAE